MSINKIVEFMNPTGDRGRTPYFHGRSDIIRNFERILSDASGSGEGTIHLIQGAPGAGKTALIDKLEGIANDCGWKSVEIDAPALWDLDALSEFFPNRNIFRWIQATLSAGLSMISVELGIKRSSRSIKKILRSSKRPLLLILDEAQMLGTSNKPVGAQAVVTSNVLKAIHNGKVGIPIILLAAGLRTTLPSLQALDISRFGERNETGLGRLSEESVRAVIRDWIVKDGVAKGDPTEWIDAIANETDGWPRHVHSYARNASDYLKENGGIMTPKGLRVVMETGRKGRVSYYKQRVKGFYVDEIKHVAQTISELPAGNAFDRLDVLTPLSKIYGETEAKELFDRLIEKGVVEDKSEEGYHIPIPSMHTWLVEAYVKSKSMGKNHDSGTKDLPANPDKLLPPPRKDDKSAKRGKTRTRTKGKRR